MRDQLDQKDRQTIAAAVAITMGAVVPILIGVALLFATGWIVAVKKTGLIHNPHDIHASLWGWITDFSYHHRKDGTRYRAADPNTIPLAWFMFWLNAWFLYELGEGIAWCVMSFARLAKQDSEVEIIDEPVVLKGDIEDPHRVTRTTYTQNWKGSD